ncbi:MAG: glycosyltransferase family 39 protein [Chitinophagaceae bacterium]|nr:glycosyltransferase family 39 protein [Chitinophagaceae bacterium]MCB9045674.1 glycosyltransferase family 39 protein [Chitinophagales bacterium]
MGDTPNNNRLTRICFYLSWLVISLLQANFTELLADEAYYWKYAQDLQWGYFDHPPVVAAMIKPGYRLFQNELGVRLLFVLSSIGFLYLMEMLVRPQKLLRFYLVLASIGAFHFLGFLALPDMPLLFFSASFLYLYKKYLATDGWIVSILLAVNATLLLLSKYHGILLIGFTVLSNPALLKRKTFWLIALLSVNLFIPHIRWQIAHDFPSLKYHLYERSGGTYHIEYTLNYLLSVLLVFGPVAGIVLAWHAIKANTRLSTFDHTLKTILIGTLVFFLAMTFKGRAEANWVAIALIPALVLGYKHIEHKDWFPRFTSYTFGISLVLIFIIRFYIVYDVLPDKPVFAYIKNKLHHTHSWAKAVEEKAGDKPVVFMNKYQYAALYEFYTGNEAISLNNRMGRKNQYNIWKDELQIQGKDVMIIPNFDCPNMDSFATGKGVFQYAYIQNFRSSPTIRIQPSINKITAHPGEEISIQFNVYSGSKDFDLEANNDLLPMVHAMLFQKDEFISDHNEHYLLLNRMVNDGQKYTLSFRVPEKKGSYALYLDIATGWLPPAISSDKIELKVLSH